MATRSFILSDPSGQTSLGEEVAADAVTIMYEDEGARIEFRDGPGVIMKFWLPTEQVWRLMARDGEPI